jgi:hypothetical protein
MDGVEYDLLVRAVKATKGVPGFSCEIGVREGGASQLIMNEFKNRIHIGVDPYGEIPYRANEIYLCKMDYTLNMQARMLSNLYTTNPEQFIFFPMEDSEFFKRFSDGVPVYRDGQKTIVNQYAFVFIDGPHSLEDVTREFDFFKDKIPTGGVVVFDDIKAYPHSDFEPKIIKAGFELLEEGTNKKSYKKVEVNNSMPPRKVLIGTPSYDGKVDVWYVNSLVQTIKDTEARGIDVHPIFLSYDALVQRSRNDLVALAVLNDFDDLIFIDGDIDWDPSWITTLLRYKVDVVGGTYRKKTDDCEEYVCRSVKNPADVDTKTGLMKVDGLGGGMIRLSSKALKHLWDTAEPYTDGSGKQARMVFEVKVIDGELISEDILMCRKLKAGGFDIHLDPRMCCGHSGHKRFTGNFVNWYDHLLASQNKDEIVEKN